MGWALAWAIGGSGPWPRPLVRMLKTDDLFFTKSLIVLYRVVGLSRLPLGGLGRGKVFILQDKFSTICNGRGKDFGEG